MASGSLLAAYLDFVSGTGTARLTSAAKPVQLVNKHTFLFKRLWNNNGMPVQGGKDMTFWFIPKGGGTFEEVLPGGTTTPTNNQVLQKGVIDWRFTRAHSTFTDPEFMLNDRIRYGSDQARFEQFVSIRDEKKTLREIDVALGLEAQLGAVPNKATMEGAATTGAVSPYSIFAHINQGTNGLYGSGFTVTPTGGVWTVKETIDPTSAAVNSNMNVTTAKYSSEAADNPANLFGGLDALWMDIRWEQPDGLAQYKSDESLNNLMLLMTKQGIQVAQSLMRGDNDRYVAGPQDPAFGSPQFHGVPMTRWDALESAAIYDGASVLQTEGNAAGTQLKGPRAYCVNGNFLYPVCHDEMMFKDGTTLVHPHVPDTHVQYQHTWWNLICKSYKHQGLLYPTANVYTGLY